MCKLLFLEDLISSIEHSNVIGNTQIDVSRIKAYEDKNLDRYALMWVNSKAASSINEDSVGIIICPSDVPKYISPHLTLIFSDYPRRTFNEALKILYKNDKEEKPFIAHSSTIHESVNLGENIHIGHNVVIEENCFLGKGVHIGHNSVIYANTIIHDEVKIGSNCTIGGVGFGYEKLKNGQYEQIMHIGNVEIHALAEIGNNTCIDRAVLGSTKIGRNVKIDNLVHISHGVQIEANALIIANAMVAGSVRIGKNSWIAPSSSILNKVIIGDDAVIGLGAVVIRDVLNNEVVVGNPAKPINKKSH